MKQNIKTTYFTALFLFAFLFHTNTNAQNIAIEQDAACINCPDLTADPSAALEVRASDKGILVPRVDSTSAISSPAEGLVIYDNSDNDFKFYDGSEWQSMGLKHISFPDISNTFIGIDAGDLNTTGFHNTATGFKALSSNTTGFLNTAYGFNAMRNNTDGVSNTAIGASALVANTTGELNTAIGLGALENNTTGQQNTAVGWAALRNNTIGIYNTANGRAALWNNTEGDSNTASGWGTLFSNETGDGNTSSGFSSLYYNTIGRLNTANGHFAMRNNTTGEHNVGIGGEALRANTIGSKNTAIGYRAFYNDSTYTNSTAVGYLAQPTGSNQVRLGNVNITSIGGYANWSNVSDARFKKQVKSNVPGLAFISLLSPVTYRMDMDAIAKHHNTPDDMRLKDSEQAKAAIRYTGFLAQDVEKAAEAIGYDFSGVDAPQHERDNYSLRYAEFVVPLVKAVQELQAVNKTKDLKITALEQKNTALEARLETIEAMLRQDVE